MTFLPNIAWSLALIALGTGVFLLIQTGKDKEMCCRRFAQVMAYLIMLLATLSLLCTGLNAYKWAKKDPHQKWKQCHYKHTSPHHKPGKKEIKKEKEKMRRVEEPTKMKR